MPGTVFGVKKPPKRTKGVRPKRVSLPFDEKHPSYGSKTPSHTPLPKGVTGTSEPGSVSVKVLLPPKLYAKLRDTVTYVGRWKNMSEFIRFALLHELDHWIDETRREKEQVEKGGTK